MAIKGKDAAYNKAAPGEPIFTLRAQDKLAPIVVRIWASLAEAHGSPGMKIAEGHLAAAEMLAWQAEHGCKIPD